MTSRDVERIIRSVLLQYGLQIGICDISLHGDVWTITLKPVDGAAMSFAIPAGTPYAFRSMLLSRLNCDG